MNYFASLFNLLFPARCLDCQKSIADQEEALCLACQKKIIIPDTLFCGVCGARLPLAKKICHQDTPYLLGSLFEYENPLAKKLIHGLKFRGLKSTGVFLGKQLALYIKKLNPHPEIISHENIVIIPIPLSRERLRERGFNQATEIANSFSKELNIPILQNILVRTKHRLPQSQTKNKKEREENAKDIFSVVSEKSLINRPVILIDDVTTTGATLRSAAKNLKTAGVKTILALTIAR